MRWLMRPAFIPIAVASVLTAQAVDHQKAQELLRQANSLFDQNRFGDAVAAYDQALEQDPVYVEVYHNRALAYEMVDHQRALQDWRRFIELAADKPDLKYDIARAQARVALLEHMPQLPDALRPGHYDSGAGDYFWEISRSSLGEKWTAFPLKVFLGSARDLKWQQGTREAFNIWSGLFPLELVTEPKEADIRMGWDESLEGQGLAGEELDWVQIKREGNDLTGRRVAVITLDVSRRWSKDEMRAIVLHEMGHALGIKGHSATRKDIMYWQVQESARQIPGLPYPLFWKSLVSKPSQRDLNTLIRLYNTPGPITRFQ
jgi:predicted Zn-dependent protease